MKRIILCCGIFAALIALSCGSLYMLKRCNSGLYERIDDCMAQYEAGSDGVYESVERLQDYWGEYYVKVSFLTRSSTLDDISYSVAKLEPLLDDESEEFVSELRSIRFWAFLVYESQIPHFRSVF